MKLSRPRLNRRPRGQESRRQSFLQRGRQRRRLFAEQLETRVLLAGDLHNWDDPFDTDANGLFTPADILHVINQINDQSRAGNSVAGGESVQYYNDVNGDGLVSPIDALHTINEFNVRAEGAGEPVVRYRVTTVTPGTNTVITTPITKGTDYELRVTVQDLRMAGGPSPPDGVFAAFLDLLYAKNLTNVEIEEIQNIQFNNNPEGGTFTLTFDRDGAGPLAAQTTAPINYDLASNPLNPEVTIAANIKSALTATFGADRFEVTPLSSGDPTQFRVRFQGVFGDQDVALMTANASGLTSSTAPPNPTITITQAVQGVYSAASFLEAFRFSPQYPNGHSANDGQAFADIAPAGPGPEDYPADPNRLDEVGGVAGLATLGSTVRELFRVRMNTVDAGVISFDGSVDQMIRPSHDTLVYGSTRDTPIPISEIEIIDSTPFTVTESFSAVADTFNFTEDPGVQTLNVKANDTPQPLTGVTIQSISTTSLSLGTLAIAAGGNSITFTPLANVNGSASFTYTLTNGSVTDTTSVTINVSAVNDAPTNTVPAGTQTTAEETAKVINGISIADIDAAETAGATMQVDLSVQNGKIDLASVSGLTFVGGADGTASMSVQGTIASINAAIAGLTYTPAQNYAGPDSLLIVTNDRGNTGTPGPRTDTDSISITVTEVNDAPIVTVPANGSSVLEGDPLVITGTSIIDVDAASGIIRATLSVTGAGTLTLGSTSNITFINGTANGQSTLDFTGTLANVNAAIASYTYTPPLGDAGTQIITVSVNDQGNTGAGGSLTDSETFTVDVIPLVRPFARRDPTPGNPASQAAFTVAEGSASNSLPVLDNDLVDDPAGPPVTDKLLISVTDPPHGTTSVSGDLVLYTPDADFWGTDTFTYVMNQDVDGNATEDGTRSTGTVTVTITNVNDAPVANNVSDSTNEDTFKDIVLSVSDIDNNNNVGFVSTLTPSVIAGPTSGTATVNANGTIRYTPGLNFNGSDSFTYRVTDETSLQSGTATVSITVNAVNDAPVAVSRTVNASEDVLLNVPVPGVKQGATDVEDPTLAGVTAELVAGPTNASSFTLNADGSFSYQGALNFNGTDSFTFRLNDGQSLSNTATITVTVGAVNDAPVANPDSYLVEEDTLFTADVQTTHPRQTVRVNDTDVDNAVTSLIVSLVSGPTNASIFNLNADGSFTYQAALDYQGPDSFVYRLTDPSAASSTTTASITVTEKNDPPVAVNDSYTATEDVLLSKNAADGVRDHVGVGQDSDPDHANSQLQVILVSGPSHALTFDLNSDGSFDYQAALNYNGPDSFTYKLVDPFGAESNTATVSINVAEDNDNPTANDDGTPVRITMIKDFDNQVINVLVNDSTAPDSPTLESLTIIRVAGSTTVGTTLLGNHVRISADGQTVLFDEDTGIEGNDQFTYTISDGRGGEATATVFVEVVNFIPTSVTGTVYVDSNNNGQIDVGEKRIAGVELRLEGHDNIFNLDFGVDTDANPANDLPALVAFTDIDGNYHFDAPNSQLAGLRPGSYTIREIQPEFMRDGTDQAGNNATLIANDRFAMTLPLLGIAGGINGNNFGERGLDPSVVSISEILASSTGNGLILAIDDSTQLWQLRLTGWTNLKSCSVQLSNDTSSATFTFTDNANNVYVRTISQVGNPRFRLMGRNADGDVLIRLDGTAADFGLTLAAASPSGQQPEGEADASSDGGYARSVDALMTAVGSA